MFKNLFSKELKKKLTDLNSQYDGLVQVLDNMNKENSGKQSREDLEKFPFLKWIALNDLVDIRRKANRFLTYLYFESILKKGGRFSKHFHPDLIESTEVVKGRIIDRADLSTGPEGRIYCQHEVMHFAYGQVHDIEALDDGTHINVIFK